MVRLFRGQGAADGLGPEHLSSPSYTSHPLEPAVRGCWFTRDAREAARYARDGGGLVYLDVTEADLERYRVSNLGPEYRGLSGDSCNEFLLPPAAKTRALPTTLEAVLAEEAARKPLPVEWHAAEVSTASPAEWFDRMTADERRCLQLAPRGTYAELRPGQRALVNLTHVEIRADAARRAEFTGGATPVVVLPRPLRLPR